MTRWLVNPWFDEGAGYDEQPGPDEVVEAATKEEAINAWTKRRGGVTSVAWWDAIPEDEWSDRARRNAHIALSRTENQ